MTLNRIVATPERLTVLDTRVTSTEGAPVATVELAQERMGAILVQSGKLSEQQLETAIDYQQRHGGKLGDAMLALGFVSQHDVAQVLGRQFEFSFTSSDHSSFDPRLHMAFNLPGEEQEAIKALRSHIQVSWLHQGQQSLLVTGVDGDDEPAMVAANLAISFSQSGKRTLLVDANLRGSLLHQALGLAGRIGLADLLAGRCRLASIIQPVLPLQQLFFVASGTQVLNPQELLARDVLAKSVRDMERDFDVVIFTTPTRIDYADNQILSTAVPGVLMLVRQHTSRIEYLQLSLSRFMVAQAKVLGCVYLKT